MNSIKFLYKDNSYSEDPKINNALFLEKRIKDFVKEFAIKYEYSEKDLLWFLFVDFVVDENTLVPWSYYEFYGLPKAMVLVKLNNLRSNMALLKLGFC